MREIADALLPLLEAEASKAERGPRTIFISGAQGIGKSTALARALKRLNVPAIGLGIDDFYLPKTARQRLARDVHPLFETRGPPGTHDIPLLTDTLCLLQAAEPGMQIALPRFSKRADDRQAEPHWLALPARPKLILLEGWLMGVAPDTASPDDAPLNRVEAEDTQGDWRRYQEDQLAGPYRRLWDMADSFIHIEAPGFETVLGWRLEQEAANLGKPPGTLSANEAAWVERFIQHYERLTRRLLTGQRRAGATIKVGAGRMAE